MEACVICKEGTMGEDVSILTEKGAASINLASRQRGHADIADEGDTVHKKCRRKFNHPKYIQAEKAADQHQNETKKILRSENIFNFQEQCIFCGLPAKFIKRKRGADVHPVLTMEFQEKVLESCTNRNDEWGHTVKGRISYVNDLHAADAVYHQTCSVNFRTGKNIPSVYSPIPSKERRLAGRPCATQQEDAFSKTCAFLANNDNEQVTVMDLTKKMAEFCDEPYTRNYMKKKLQTHFGSDILITEINGLPDVVTFCYLAKSILYDFYKRPQSSSDKESIIKAAARFILSDIKSIQASTTLYPSLSEIESLSSQISYVPDSLQLLLSNIFLQNSKDLKIASIGQAIMQTSRPRALLAPIQISLGIQLDQQFASRFLLDTLNSLGFSASYSEIKRFQSNAAVEQGQSQINLDTNSSLQFVADNVDHNSCTVDGHGTFHGMGIIGSFTPGSKFNRVIPRNDLSKESILEAGTIDVLFYKRPQTKEQHFIKLREMDVDDDFWFAYLLCNVLWPLRTPRISWSGFMQMFRSGQYPGKSSTVFFPMIDLPPSDMTCIFSTLHFVCKEASKYEKTPVITFDQPLYWKARQIISDEADDSILKSVVLRLGGFHLQMSFLGAIGHIMSGSGLQEVLETVFAPNAVGHMVSGKAVSRAIRGHNLVSSGLNAILLAQIFELDLPSTSITAELNLSSSESRTDNGEPSEGLNHQGVPEVAIQIESEDDLSGRTIDPLLDKACSLYDSLLSGETKLEELAGDEIFDRILSKLEEEKKSLETKRTAKLWLQYLDMVHLLMKFIEAERTGNWKLHQKTISMMLPYLAAASHNLYLKSAYLYLSDMQQLESKHPEIYAFFEAGHHVIRRSDRFWAGLSSDIVIEQVLMRSMKTSGGLTRGRGMTELQRVQWLLSSPACAEINYAMQTLTGVNYHTSDQHKESGKARQSRDDRDAFIVLKHVMERNPFDGNEELRSIETGIVADQKVNVDRSKEIGLEIVNSLPIYFWIFF
ncbi:hypothetical protein FSP39_025112 [Pinctada imbricata]|uniref:Uncharacterized protein n=1 Tax=Pinctada imbricata TaxID=66713 RepID=A0AA88XXI8_PINIB|nr:hypothetical protein FSP39_025112 [Pinctada imbricata]